MNNYKDLIIFKHHIFIYVGFPKNFEFIFYLNKYLFRFGIPFFYFEIGEVEPF